MECVSSQPQPCGLAQHTRQAPSTAQPAHVREPARPQRRAIKPPDAQLLRIVHPYCSSALSHSTTSSSSSSCLRLSHDSPPPPLPSYTAPTLPLRPSLLRANVSRTLPHPLNQPGLAPSNAHAPGHSSSACRPCLCSIAAACLIRSALRSETPATTALEAMPRLLRQPPLARSASMRGQPRDLRVQWTTPTDRPRPPCNPRMPGRSASQCSSSAHTPNLICPLVRNMMLRRR